MTNFFDYFYQDLGRVFRAFLDWIMAFFTFLNYLLNYPMRMKIIESYAEDFTRKDWIMLLIANILLVVIIVGIFILLGKLFKKIFRFRVPVKKYDELVKQVKALQTELIRANFEKDKLLAMRVAELGMDPDKATTDKIISGLYGNQIEGVETTSGEATDNGMSKVNPNRNTVDSPVVDSSKSRFFRLTEVDNYYKTQYVPPVYEDVSLEEFCTRLRLFAASRYKLYYDISTIRYFIAALGASRIVILQGISGTGKTSLPYVFGKFVQKDTTVVSVQPAWRERTELYGYYNEFTKKYTETDFLKAIYESNYYEDPHLVILDEMNIARVEYYFAEMLSILEMPIKSEWKIDIVASVWDNDPCLIEQGKVQIGDNLWFVGTINNDDSTFAVADKVYDRAIPIDLDSRAEAFTCEDADAVYVSANHLNSLFEQAKIEHQVSQEILDKLEEVNVYLINNFKLAFGNRIMKQIKDYVPSYMACGGTEIEGVDFIVAKKVLRKFESLSLGFMRDDLTKFSNYLDKVFGKNSMKICKDYIEFLKRNN